MKYIRKIFNAYLNFITFLTHYSSFSVGASIQVLLPAIFVSGFAYGFAKVTIQNLDTFIL